MGRVQCRAGPDAGSWRLEVTLSEQGGGTTLRFVQRLAEPYDASSIGPGWHFSLDRLAAVVQGREVPEDFVAYSPALQDQYAVRGQPGHARSSRR